MPACNLIIDSCCDLPHEMIDQPGITMLPFPYFFDDEEFADDLFQSVTAKDFYDRMRTGARPTTAQLPMARLIDCFESFADSDKPTVYLSFTSGMSKSFDVACMAADQVREAHPDMELHVVDTLMASSGEALIVAEAINQWKAGLTAQELEDWTVQARRTANVCFFVDDLGNLARGGRMPKSIAYVGSKISLKPLLYIAKDGSIQTWGAVRGRKKAIAKLVSTMEKRLDKNCPYKQIIIGHCDCPDDAQALAAEISQAHPDAEVIVTNVCSTVGCHEGPGAMNLSFWGQDRNYD